MNSSDVIWTSERWSGEDSKTVKVEHTEACLERWRLTPTAADVDDESGFSMCDHQIWVSPHRIVDWSKE